MTGQSFILDGKCSTICFLWWRLLLSWCTSSLCSYYISRWLPLGRKVYAFWFRNRIQAAVSLTKGLGYLCRFPPHFFFFFFGDPLGYDGNSTPLLSLVVMVLWALSINEVLHTKIRLQDLAPHFFSTPLAQDDLMSSSSTVGYSQNRDSIAVVHTISLHVKCTRDSCNLLLI